MESCNPVFKPLFHTSIPSILKYVLTHIHAHAYARAPVYVREALGMEGMEGIEEQAPMRLSRFHTCSIPHARYGTF
ncbi:MAG: hypothetical protein K2P74_01640 [Nitrosomonas sp.]|nr:hypothetical protein [Nitrosomonas sp.]